ncbi:MAG: tRNA (adenosine(37)-N6)-dimethylallyltransferase MiaA [Bacillota bacterium]
MITVVAIMGPTAVGKTELSLRLGKAFQGEIISVDSRQVYRYLDIGTAKPGLEQRNQIPHHLIDVALPTEQYTVGRFQSDAAVLISEISGRKKLPFLVGGTGLYFKAILEGFNLPGPPVNLALRKHLMEEHEKQGGSYLYDMLARIDPETARQIHPNDTYRIIRSLEIYKTAGIPVSLQKRKNGGAYRAIKIGLLRERDELYRRINTRVELMYEQNLPGEVKNLCRMGYSHGRGFQKTIGYPETLWFLMGESTLDEAKRITAHKTRNYAKRQLTWFKREKGIRWFNLTNQPPDKIFKEIFWYIAGELKKNENIMETREI